MSTHELGELLDALAMDAEWLRPDKTPRSLTTLIVSSVSVIPGVIPRVISGITPGRVSGRLCSEVFFGGTGLEFLRSSTSVSIRLSCALIAAVRVARSALIVDIVDTIPSMDLA